MFTEDMNFAQIRQFFWDFGQTVVFWATHLKKEVTKEMWNDFSADEVLAIYEAAEDGNPLKTLAWYNLEAKDLGFAVVLKKFDESDNDREKAVALEDMMSRSDSFRKALAVYERTLDESPEETESLTNVLALMKTVEDYNLALLLTDADPETIHKGANSIINTLQEEPM